MRPKLHNVSKLYQPVLPAPCLHSCGSLSTLLSLPTYFLVHLIKSYSKKKKKILFILKKFFWDATTTIKPFQSKVFESFEHLSSREHLCFTFYYICLFILIPAKSPRFHLLIPKLVQRPPCIWPKHQISSIRFLCEGKWKKKISNFDPDWVGSPGV